MSRAQDLLGVIKGIQKIAQEGAKVQSAALKVIWANSSVRSAIDNAAKNAQNSVKQSDIKNVNDVVKVVADTTDRLSAVAHGIKEFATNSPSSSSLSGKAGSHTEKVAVSSQTVAKQDAKPFTGVEKLKGSDFEIKLTKRDKELLKKLDMEHREKMKTGEKSQDIREEIASQIADVERDKGKTLDVPKVTAIPNPKSRQTLSASAKQRKVPSSRISRMMSFGGLAAGLGIGTAAEYARRTLGLSESATATDLFLTPANMDRIVDTLCKVRGAALKMGQMLSIQDETVVSPALAKALERVRKSADFMPVWQVDQVLQSELGADWRDKFEFFHEKPFAAASIGQVHWGKTKEGREVAVKIQYPGVAKGIESDIDNLVGVIKLWDMFPKGMFLDNLINVAKRELAWEVDYIREAECTRKFRQLLQKYPDYYVPEVIDHLCTGQVFTTELIEGIPVDQCVNLDLEHRNFIAMKALELCLRELLEFRYMQTDPNWANFFYDPQRKKLLLLDFGASREYSREFTDKYVKIIRAAAEGDRNTVLLASRELGFLTGYESKIMEEAHIDAVMILGEVFRCPGEFNFAAQDTTTKITHLMPTMLQHRLCPPPEEVYSLHRKLSGVFLLCSKLKVAIAVRPLFVELCNKYDSNK